MSRKTALLVFFFAVLLFAWALPASAGEPWRPGHIYCPDASKSVPGGELPAGTRIVLEDGTSVEVAGLSADDAFRRLIEHWVKARKGYHSESTVVNGFVYKLDSLDLGGVVRNVEIRYGSGGFVLHTVKGITHVIH